MFSNNTSTQNTFNFGGTNNKPAFGNPVTSTGLFGATTTSTTSLFGANQSFRSSSSTSNVPFGNTISNATTPFGTATLISNTGFGVQASVSTTPFTLNKQATSIGFGNTAFGTGGFNNTSNTNTAFGNKPMGFGSVFNTNQPFGTTQNQPNLNNQTNEQDLFLTSVTYPAICGDERDIIIQRWNQLQAMYGSGVGLCCKGKAIYNQENPISRFKSVAFNKLPKTDDNDGFVALLVRKPFQEVVNNKIAIKEKIYQMIGIQTIKVEIEDIKPAIKVFSNPITTQQPQNKPAFGFAQPVQQINTSSALNNTSTNNQQHTEIFIKLIETLPNGSTRYVLASNLVAHFKNEPLKTKLFNELMVVDVVAHVSPQNKDISDYLNGPAPRGLDPELWDKAKSMCSYDSSLVPVPIIGMNELKARMTGQIQFASIQLATIKKESDTVSDMKLKIKSMSSKIDQMKRKQMELNSRILKIFCHKEAITKQGYALSGEEETLKCTLEKLWLQIVGNHGLKNQLHELLANPKLMYTSPNLAKLPENSLTKENIEELKEYFSERQKSIKEMMKLLRENIASINIIERSS